LGLINQKSAISAEDIQLLNTEICSIGYELVVTEGYLKLHSLNTKFKPLFIDFVDGKNRHRRLFGGGRKQPLAKAVGMKKSHNPTVFDLTAGLGRDAFVLVSLGCHVSMYERSSIISALLADALRRMSQDYELKEISLRFELKYGDSLNLLKYLNVEDYPEVIYMDPMYPEHGKSALVKKEMRIFRELVGSDDDSVELLLLAQQRCTKRVAVKRPKGSEPLGGIKPNTSISSPNTRYDIYLV